MRSLKVPKHAVKSRFQKDIKAFGTNLKKIRKAKGVTLEQLGYESQIAYSSIFNIESGKINPTLGSILAIAKALKIPAKTLMDF